MPVDGAVVTQAQVLEQHARQEQVLDARFHAARELEHVLAADHLDETCRLLVQMFVRRMRGDTVEVAGHGTHVLGDGPFVVVEHDDEPFGRLGDVVERLVGDAAGKRRVARHADDVFVAAALVAPRRHAQRRRERRARVPRAVAVVLAFRAQHEPVEALVLADRLDVPGPALGGEHLVNVGLVAHVENELVLGRAEHAVQRDGQFDHAEVRPEVSADARRVGLAHHVDQLLADLLGELREVALGQRLQVVGRLDLVEQADARLGDGRSLDGDGFRRG